MATGGLTIKLEGCDLNAEKLRKRSPKFSDKMARALQTVAKIAKEEIETEGRANIRAGGNFSSARWQQGFQAKISFESRVKMNIRVSHSVSYWKVFEQGAVIRGKPMLWIPLSGSTADGLGVSARNYGAPLFYVMTKKGTPLLHDGIAPQYFGKTEVRIPKKWRLSVIIRAISRKLGKYYREAMHG